MQNVIDFLNWLGPWAILLQILGSLWAGASFTYLLCRRKWVSRDAIIARQEGDLRRRNIELDVANSALIKLKAEFKDLRTLLPSGAVEAAAACDDSGDPRGAIMALTGWVERNAKGVSDLLTALATNTFSYAHGSRREHGLITALHYAELANRISANNEAAQATEAELRKYVELEGFSIQDHAPALDELGFDPGDEMFDAGAIEHATDLVNDARRLRNESLLQLALEALAQALPILKSQLGITSRQYLEAEADRWDILELVDRSALAIRGMDNLLRDLSTDLPGTHQDVLKIRVKRWRALVQLGRGSDEIGAARELVETLNEHAEFGPLHESTIDAERYLAEALDYNAQTDSGIKLIKSVIDKLLESPFFGEDHDKTLRCMTKLGWMLSRQRRLDESIKLMTTVATTREKHPDYGPRHPLTLEAWRHVADSMGLQGRNREALPIAEKVVTGLFDDPHSGPYHISTLAAQFLQARLLSRMGEFSRALPIFEDTATKQIENPEIGRLHKDSLVTRTFLAESLLEVGRANEALVVIQTVLSDWRKSGLSQNDHERQNARDLLSRIGSATPTEETELPPGFSTLAWGGYRLGELPLPLEGSGDAPQETTEGTRGKDSTSGAGVAASPDNPDGVQDDHDLALNKN